MKKIKQTLLAIILVLLALNNAVCAIEPKMGITMNNRNTTLWQLIEELALPPLFSPETIRRTLPIEFFERRNNGHLSFYEGGPLYLTDHVTIKKITLRVRQSDGMIRSLVLDLASSSLCVKLDDVHKHYPNTEITGAPRGGSLDEKTYWTVRQSWLRLSFGFKEGNPDCLASVGIGRNETHSTSKNHPQSDSHQ